MNLDFFVYDTEQLNTLASRQTVQNGLSYFTENRVFDLRMDDYGVTAMVEGHEQDLDYTVELFDNGAEELDCLCNCQSPETFCKHAIAALYRIAEFQLEQQQESLGGAVDEAIQERVKKGRNEVNVKLVSGNLAFGVWEARSIISATYRKTAYQVHIRSLDQRMNYCTCPDLATNRLGTCKHIEAVLHSAKKHKDYDALAAQGAPLSFVYLAWESSTHPIIKMHPAKSAEADLLTELREFFDQRGQFSGRLPDDFNALLNRFQGREDLLIGEDVRNYVRQIAEDMAHQLRAQQIERQIMQMQGLMPGIKARLFPYQREGVAFLASRGRALLADDMGLGKTLQSIVAATWLADNAGVSKALVVCPASLKHQWAREIEKFTGKTARIIQGTAENRAVQYRDHALFYIVNYELALRDLSVINETLKPDLLILDEAQRIKNWRTKIASTIKLIPSRYAFVLTGTPLENRIEDLYSLLQVVDARILGPLWRCLLDFHVTDEKGKVIGYRNLSELRRRISSVMLRRNRSLVSDQLPERSEVVLDLPLTAAQKELHDAAMSAAGQLANIAARRPLTPGESNRLMAALQQARMACNAAGLVDKQTEGSPKLDELADLLDEICLQSNRKVVVFSQWTMMTEMVERLAQSLNLGFVRLHGGIPTHKRGELTDRFQNDDAVQVFISTDAGGVGLNLQSATALVNLDMPWNPAVLDQRIARIHRLGQKQNVQIFLLLAENAYEQRVAELVSGKRNLFDNVVSPEATEDVVGVSKKMLDSIIDDLNGQPAAAKKEQAELTATAEAAEKADDPSKAKAKSGGEDSAINALVGDIQSTLGARIERIIGSGGGLLVVVHQSEAEDDALAQQWSAEGMPVAVLDGKTYLSLQRLGHFMADGENAVVYQTENAEPQKNPLYQLAAEKLNAAEILLQQQCMAGVMDLLAAAALTLTAALNDQQQAPGLDKAAVWLMTDIQARQLLNGEQTAKIISIISLAQSDEIPEALIENAAQDVKQLIEQYGSE